MKDIPFRKRSFSLIVIYTFLLCCSPNTEMPKESPTKKLDVVWIVIDSLRADVIGKYGVTPELESFQKISTNFEYHLVNAAWTRPSTLVFFTGNYASANPVNFWDYPTPQEEANLFYQTIKEPLPKYLTTFGYKTQMVGNNPFLTDKNGLGVDVGFDSITDFSLSSDDTRKITKKVISVVEERDINLPVFLFVNYNDPHKPYTPPDGYIERIQTNEVLDERKRNYLGEVAFVDEELGKLFKTLKQQGIWDKALIIITADHGEVMHPEHAISPFTGTNTYFGHGQDLFLENIHVPLLIKFPNQVQGKKIPYLTRSIDLYPTILDVLQAPIPKFVLGKSLLPMFRGEEKLDRVYYGETRFTQAYGEGKKFLLQRSYRFHQIGKFWQGNVGKEFFLYTDTNLDPEQILGTRFESLDDLEKTKLPLSEKHRIHKFINNLRLIEPKLSKYYLSILSKDPVEIKLRTSQGKILLNQIPPSSEVLKSDRMIQISFSSKLREEICFSIYPDIVLPTFEIYMGGKKVSDIDILTGMYGISWVVAAKENALWEVSYAKPRIHPSTSVHLWKEANFMKQYKAESTLSTDAMEILKKQGYVQE